MIEDKEGYYDPVMDKEAPSRVKPVSRLRNDLTALTLLFEGEEPK